MDSESQFSEVSFGKPNQFLEETPKFKNIILI